MKNATGFYTVLMPVYHYNSNNRPDKILHRIFYGKYTDKLTAIQHAKLSGGQVWKGARRIY